MNAQPKNPHCLHVTWKKASDPVTGYRVYCFPGDSEKAEVIKDVHDRNQDSVVISGLKPGDVYRVGISSVSSGTESELVSSEEKIKLRMLYQKHLL